MQILGLLLLTLFQVNFFYLRHFLFIIFVIISSQYFYHSTVHISHSVFIIFYITSYQCFLLFNILSCSAFITFVLVSIWRYYHSTFCPFNVFLPFNLLFFTSTYCRWILPASNPQHLTRVGPGYRASTLFSLPFISLCLCPLDVIYHSTFCPLTFFFSICHFVFLLRHLSVNLPSI
jgi:hypothetical protein